MTEFTPFASLLGGVLIGAAASLMLLLSGRIAGVSGIAGGVLAPAKGDVAWRLLFLAGLIVGGLVLRMLAPESLSFGLSRSTMALVAAGALVGFGSRLGSGCTSGHGVCGISRLSKRSIMATATFMATGMITVYFVNQVFGGAL